MQHRPAQRPANQHDAAKPRRAESRILRAGAKGNTATNVTKPVKVETGAEFPCPFFVNIGDLIKIDTRTGEYLERVKE